MDPPQPYTTPSPQLQAYINKTLRVTTTDGRFFVGDLKCTDRDRNLILASTSEYRYPPVQEREQEGEGSGKVRVDLKNRFIGLVVVPGNVITKIEVEERGTSNARRGWAFGSFGTADPARMSIV
ncbi:hypothetical protein BDD12DRAFT_279415 [Trichophaea hybrida]|nr:hypothetical protein BDD12DRAFT_279415 [Trichophaea hybrida]